MKLCSACLLGVNCRYDGGNKRNRKVIELSKKEELIPVCTELLAGLKIPRDQTEATGSGELVLDGKAKIITKDEKDVTEIFIQGSKKVLEIARKYGIKEVILKQKSATCGCGKIYDGTFSGKLISGDGVTTALLKRNGIKVISEEDLR